MIEHNINKLNNFIHGVYINNDSFYNDVIEHYLNSEKKYQGISSKGIDVSWKKSTDCLLESELKHRYFNECLEYAIPHYVNKYPYVNYYSSWGVDETINIQHYIPSEAFYAWHCERSGAVRGSPNRHLTFITYLNDVTDGGETEFYHQNLKIKPEKGLTIIFPVDWTFTHRGVPSLSEEKYIITGWCSFTS